MFVNTKQVHLARNELLETGAVSEPRTRSVRPEILASWRRSSAFGAQPNVKTLPYQDDLAATGRLVDAAEPVLRSLAASLAGLHAGVLLADRDANIVQRWVADPSILRSLDRICSDAGFSAAEERVGTNGIGIVAELGRAQLVVGPEHFAESLIPFACVGAPIHSPTTRRLEGIITLSCKAELANALLTPLMVSTAADIENRLLMSSTLDERRMLDAYLAAKRQHRMVAAVGRDLLIAGAKATRRLDQLVDRDILWEVVSQVAPSSAPMHRTVPSKDGGEVSLMCVPVHDGGRLIGAIVDLEDVARMAALPRRRASPPGRISLPGDHPRWVETLDSAARFADERVPVVLVGARGTGKWRIVREMIGGAVDSATTLTIDCADLDELTPMVEWPPTAEPVRLILLRHLEALSERGLRDLGALVDGCRGDGMPWIVATLCSLDGTIGDDHRRLIDRFEGVVLQVPSLAERPDDIRAIVRDLMAKHGRGRAVHLSADAVAELSRACWPGNIRQLDEVIRSTVASRLGEITVADLPAGVCARTVRRSLSTIDQLECEAIVKALDQAAGNKVVAARLIGLSRSTIYRKIRAYGIDPDAAFF